jgi:hypothetical protein
MSHTDKTDPYWVHAEWWEPCHYRCPHTASPRYECDLPDEPIRDPVYSVRFRVNACHWTPVWDRRAYGSYVPQWFNRVYFTRPERRRVRDQLTLARAEHRATGEVDVIPEARQHRHQGRWLYW